MKTALISGPRADCSLEGWVAAALAVASAAFQEEEAVSAAEGSPGGFEMEKKIKCPRCSVLINRWMRKLKHPSGATLDVCDRCGGLWLDKEEVRLLSKVKKK